MNANISASTITMTKTEAKAAGKFGTPEFNELIALRTQFPTFRIEVKLDEDHFTVEATVEVSDQFYGWLLGFGRRVKILEPEPVVEGFKAYLDKIRAMYE